MHGLVLALSLVNAVLNYKVLSLVHGLHVVPRNIHESRHKLRYIFLLEFESVKTLNSSVGLILDKDRGIAEHDGVLGLAVGDAFNLLKSFEEVLLVDVVHNNSLVCADILSKLDALIDLSMALEKLKHGFMSGLAQPTRMFFKEFVEFLLFQHYLLLCRLDLSYVLKSLGCRLHLVYLIKL